MKQYELIEDAEGAGGPADPERVLDDEQLHQGGLRPVVAWVRTKASKNALRVKKARDKRALDGVRQVNVQAPESVHATLKEIATRTAGGEALEVVLGGLVGQSPADAQLLQVAHSDTWRGWLIRHLVGAGPRTPQP